MKTGMLPALLAACSLWLTTSAQAQMPPAPPGPVRPAEAIKRILDLTDQQVQQLADLRTSHTNQVRTLTTQVRDLARRQRELLESSTPDPAQVGALVIQIGGLRKQLQDARTAYHNAALALLTETQKQKVAQIQQALELAPQAGPLAAFGLLEGPGPGQGPRPGMRFREGGGMGFEAPLPPPDGAPQGGMMMFRRRGF